MERNPSVWYRAMHLVERKSEPLPNIQAMVPLSLLQMVRSGNRTWSQNWGGTEMGPMAQGTYSLQS